MTAKRGRPARSGGTLMPDSAIPAGRQLLALRRVFRLRRLLCRGPAVVSVKRPLDRRDDGIDRVASRRPLLTAVVVVVATEPPNPARA